MKPDLQKLLERPDTDIPELAQVRAGMGGTALLQCCERRRDELRGRLETMPLDNLSAVLDTLREVRTLRWVLDLETEAKALCQSGKLGQRMKAE